MPSPRNNNGTKRNGSNGRDPETRLSAAVERAALALEKQNSFPRRFFLGIMTGIGTAIGATVFAGLVILLLSRLFQAAGIEEILQQR